MREKIVAGNWKMHGSKAMVANLLTELKNSLSKSACKVIVFPPAIYLAQTQTVLENSVIKFGAQNVAEIDQGAFTGEISAPMLVEFGCEYVLIGHSERRQYFSETNQSVAKKMVIANQYNLKPVVCVGETLIERNNNQTFEVIKNQINSILTLENWSKLLQNAVLAYEPVWAIGTGRSASPEEAQEVHKFIRNTIAACDEKVAANLPIIYGGSVKPDNAKSLFAKPDIDGALVGGASLIVNDFLEIIQCNS